MGGLYRLLALACALKDGTRPTALQRFHRITNAAGDCVGRGQGLVILLRPETDSVNPLHAYLCNPHAC